MINMILHNAYRVIAIPLYATERECIARIDEIQTSASIGRKIHFDYDRIWPGPVERDMKAVKNAAEAIRSPDRRIEHVLMWFWECDEADRVAIAELENGNLENAEGILLKSGTVLEDNNISHLKNLALLYMRIMFDNVNHSKFLKKYCIKTVEIWDKLLGFPPFFKKLESLTDSKNYVLSAKSAAKIVYNCIEQLCCMQASGKPSIEFFRIMSRSEFLSPFVPDSCTKLDHINKQSINILKNIFKTVLISTKRSVYEAFKYLSGLISIAVVYGMFALLPLVCEMFEIRDKTYIHEETYKAKNSRVKETNRNITANTTRTYNELDMESLTMDIDEKRYRLEEIESEMEILESEIEESDNTLRLLEDEIEDEDYYDDFEYEQAVMDYENRLDEYSDLKDELEQEIEELEDIALEMDY